MEIGQKVLIVEFCRNSKNIECEGEIRKIGKKWVTVAYKIFEQQFDKNTGWINAGDYTPTQRMYLNTEDYYAEKEAKDLTKKIRDAVSGYSTLNYPLTVLRQVNELLTQTAPGTETGE